MTVYVLFGWGERVDAVVATKEMAEAMGYYCPIDPRDPRYDDGNGWYEEHEVKG